MSEPSKNSLDLTNVDHWKQNVVGPCEKLVIEENHGACVSRVPVDVAMRLHAAQAASARKIYDKGWSQDRTLEALDLKSLRTPVARVHKSLLSVDDLVEKNNRVVFDSEPGGSYVERKVDGSRIHLTRNDDVSELEFDRMSLTLLLGLEEVMSGFGRQVKELI